MTVDADDYDTFVTLVNRFSIEEAELRLLRMGLPADNTAALRREYEARIAAVEAGFPPTIIAVPREAWYPGPTDSDLHWPAFKRHLAEELGWPESRIEELDGASSKIIGHTPKPSGTKWTCKGLVIGYVQSGKTTNFTAVTAKAVDVGYNLVIVLSGIHNGLRRQTQVRLQTQLCDMVPDNWVPLTSDNLDFRRQTMMLGPLLDDHGAVLCVVKKNPAVLRKLNRWLEDSFRSGAGANVKALVIDDESDQASVDTRTINPLIRGLIDNLPRCSYIGYTATPFANVLIDPAGRDLYPENFILNLPRPDGYFGTEMIFGRDEIEELGDLGVPLDGYDMVRLIPETDAETFRYRRNRAYEPELTDNLRSAVAWFLLATAVRRTRGDLGHSTMLVHTSMQTIAHHGMQFPIRDFLAEVGSGLDDARAELIAELRELYDRESAKVDASEFGLLKVDFDAVLNVLADVVADTEIILDNSTSNSRLDYDSDEPVTAIAIGGNTLSRGLTLEGLVVSFFVRAARAYDTLLQMGRWFGFRPGYQDLPRIWMTPELERWFRHLATVEHEIRLDVDRYEESVSSPLEFGVRIRTHPALLVTTKMGAAVVAFSSYGGRRVQSRFFKPDDHAWLETNRDAADALMSAIASDGTPAEPNGEGPVVFRDVPAGHVMTFLHSYQAHEDSPDLDSGLITKYIDKQLETGGLERWNIAVVAGPSEGTSPISTLGGVDYRTISRSRLNDSRHDRADIKTLMSKDHRVIDLPITPAEARRRPERELMSMRNAAGADARGLLLLYPIDPDSSPQPTHTHRIPLGAVSAVIGLALVFPGNADVAVSSSFVQVDLSARQIEDDDPEAVNVLQDDTENDGPSEQS